MGVFVDAQLKLAMHACSPERQLCPGLHQKKSGQQDYGGDSPLLLCSQCKKNREGLVVAR